MYKVNQYEKFANYISTVEDEHIMSNLLYMLISNRCRSLNMNEEGELIHNYKNRWDYHTVRIQHELIDYFKKHKDFVQKVIDEDLYSEYRSELKQLMKMIN